MLHAFGQVSYFYDGVTKTGKTKGRGTTVPLFSTGEPLSDAEAQAVIKGINFPQIPGYSAVISTQWRLHSVALTQTRVWACSSVKFTLVTPFVTTRGGKNVLYLPPIHPEMPLVVDLGYVSELYAKPLLGPLSGGSAQINGVQQRVYQDNEGPAYGVRRRFMGYVEQIQIKVTTKRIICTITCRDKLRFLIDNRMVGYFNAYDLISASGDEIAAKLDKPQGQNFADGIARQYIIKELLVSGSNGGITVADISSDGKENLENITGFKAGQVDEGSIGAQAGEGGVREKIQPAEDSTEPSAISNSFIVMNKAPIEPLKRLSTLEAYLPKELYADHNGSVHWKKREARNFDNPFKYYLLEKPEGVEDAMPIISATSEFSTIGTVNQIVVVNPLYGTGNNSSSVMALAATLDTSKALGFEMLPRTRFIFDETLNAKEMAAEVVKPVVEAEFMIWGKDIRGSDVEVAGNPALYVGDAVRTYNLPMFDYTDADSRTLRADSVVDQLVSEGPKKGYRTRILLSQPVETYKDVVREALKHPGAIRDFSQAMNTGIGKSALSKAQEGGP